MESKWDKRFMDIAESVSTWSSCLRHNVGCVIVKDRRILTTGYNGAPTGVESCVFRNSCIRIKNNIPSGTQIEKCYGVHAEQNAIIQASRLGLSVMGGTLYCTHKPCSTCAKIIINSGITEVVYKEEYPDSFTDELFRKSNTKIRRIDEDGD